MSHQEPDLVKVHVDLPNHWLHKGESIWAKCLGDDLYEIDNVPFCAYGLNCGDVVRATAESPELKPEVREVVRRGGHRTLRVMFDTGLALEGQAPFVKVLENMGVWIERMSNHFVSLDLPPATDYEAVRSYLNVSQAEGSLHYETCEERVPGSFDDVAEDTE